MRAVLITASRHSPAVFVEQHRCVDGRLATGHSAGASFRLTGSPKSWLPVLDFVSHCALSGARVTPDSGRNKSSPIRSERTFHDLRRSYASLLINRGTDAEVIRELLGYVEGAWMEEVTRRAAELDSGAAQSIPWDIARPPWRTR